MTHYYPLVRSISMLVMGAIGLLISAVLMQFLFVSVLLLVMSVVAIYIGFKGITKRKNEPMRMSDNSLSFYRRGKVIEVRRDNIIKIFYNTKGIDKRVTILTKDEKEIDIPVVYGLAELVRKLNKHLSIT